MKRQFTANYKKDGKWYSGWIEEIPGVNTQGATLAEVKEKHLQKYGCALFREGAKHSVYINEHERKISIVSRHDEINNFLAKKIAVI